MNPPPDPLDRLLDRWNPPTPDTTGLKGEMWRRIGRLEKAPARSGLQHRLESQFARPALILLFGAASVMGVLFFAEWRTTLRQSQVSAELARQYLRLIDPLEDEPALAGSLDRELAWLRDTLHLSPAQFARIKEFHEASGPKLSALAQEVVRMRQESSRLDAERRNAGRVDFLAVARVVETQRTVDRECLESTQKLVQATATIMTPEQRRRYWEYVRAALDPVPRPAFN